MTSYLGGFVSLRVFFPFLLHFRINLLVGRGIDFGNITPTDRGTALQIAEIDGKQRSANKANPFH